MTQQNRYLMCMPSYFDVSYVINPWMQGNVKGTQLMLATNQWQGLHKLISQHASVELVQPQPGLPDMPFTANAGLILEDVVILSRFLYPERQAEEIHFERWFYDQGLAVLKLPSNVPFEGAGDALFDRERALLWMGHGHRSSIKSVPYISRWLDREVVPLQLADPRFYHLDTCFCPLQNGYLMYYPGGFDAASQKVIAQRIPEEKRIVVAEEDALSFACNAVNIGSKIILNHASDSLTQQLTGGGFSVIQNELSEFMKSGGSAKCLTLRMNEQRII